MTDMSDMVQEFLYSCPKVEKHENNVYSYVFPIIYEVNISSNDIISSMPVRDDDIKELENNLPSEIKISPNSYYIEPMAIGDKYITKEGYLTEEGLQDFLKSGDKYVSTYVSILKKNPKNRKLKNHNN